MRLPDRLLENAKQLTKDYSRANDILHTAVREAMPWAAPLAMSGVVPSVDRIERLCIQCLAILIATYPEEFENPVRGFGENG